MISFWSRSSGQVSGNPISQEETMHRWLKFLIAHRGLGSTTCIFFHQRIIHSAHLLQQYSGQMSTGAMSRDNNKHSSPRLLVENTTRINNSNTGMGWNELYLKGEQEW
jgi:hypothetical protein